MSRKQDIPAFPRLNGFDELSHETHNAQEGMSLRAYIATKALSALISRPDKDDVKRGSKGVPILADYAVEYADALISALDAK